MNYREYGAESGCPIFPSELARRSPDRDSNLFLLRGRIARYTSKRRTPIINTDQWPRSSRSKTADLRNERSCSLKRRQSKEGIWINHYRGREGKQFSQNGKGPGRRLSDCRSGIQIGEQEIVNELEHRWELRYIETIPPPCRDAPEAAFRSEKKRPGLSFSPGDR
jgi:hypothetical protein